MKTIQNKKGVALLIIVVFFLALSLLMAGLFSISIGNFENQNTATTHSSSYFVAESGINLVTAQFEDEINALIEDTSLTDTEFVNALNTLATTLNGSIYNNASTDNFSNDVGTADATISVVSSTEDGYQKYVITSIGTVDGISRTLSKTIKFQYELGEGNGFNIDKAVLVSNKITTTLATNIIHPDGAGADVATYSQISSEVNISTTTTMDDIYLLEETNSNVVLRKPSSATVYKDYPYKAFPIIDFTRVDNIAKIVRTENKSLPALVTGNNTINPSNGTYGGYYVPTLTFNKDMSINVTGDTFIVTDRIAFGVNYKTINFTGVGKLEIYVGNPNLDNPNLTTPTFATINNGVNFGNSTNVKNLIVYVASYRISNVAPDINLSGNNAQVHGSFMFENARLYFSNNCTFNGYLVTNAVDSSTSSTAVRLSNNGSLNTKGLIFAPSGTVRFENNSGYKGAIVAKNVNLIKATLVYDPLEFMGMPFVINDPINQSGFSGGSVINFDLGSTVEVD